MAKPSLLSERPSYKYRALKYLITYQEGCQMEL
jgi:hypothetical protein